MSRRITLSFILIGMIAGRATAETDTTVRDSLINGFKKCVMEAALASNNQSNKLKAEQSFVACGTEEQAFRSWMQLAGVPVDVAQALVVRLKLDLKKIIAP